jgi:protein-S-isoprenylcysteine O-methyltransferase Ste14
MNHAEANTMTHTANTTEVPRAPIRDRCLDAVARAGILLAFSYLACVKVIVIQLNLPLDSINKALTVLAAISNAVFLGLIALTALTRLRPIRKAKGIEPRVSALTGTFMCLGLAFLPKADLGGFFSALSSVLIIVGASLSFLVLRWLGRSFSLAAEARRLVTGGPYRFVRHPLYFCEGITVLGMVLQVLSPWAVLIFLLFAAVQYRRMINEEAVLESVFPEYLEYAVRTPRIIPVDLLASYASRPAA